MPEENCTVCPPGRLKRTTGRQVVELSLEREASRSITVPGASAAPAMKLRVAWNQYSAPASIARPTAVNRYLTIARVFIFQGAGSRKPASQCEPSQNGLFFDWP